MFASQDDFDIRFECGLEGLRATTGGGAVILVDVFSFTTCVTIAAERGASVIPSAGPIAPRSRDHVSLSPESMLGVERGACITLASQNGAMVALAAEGIASRVWAASLRNATAVARRAQSDGLPVTVIAAGERWPDGNLRFALEDVLGAGAAIAAMHGRCSPEAAAAATVFTAARASLAATLAACSSGREMLERGFARDVELASQYDVSDVVPLLRDGRFRVAM